MAFAVQDTGGVCTRVVYGDPVPETQIDVEVDEGADCNAQAVVDAAADQLGGGDRYVPSRGRVMTGGGTRCPTT